MTRSWLYGGPARPSAISWGPTVLLVGVGLIASPQPLQAGTVLSFDHNPIGNFVRIDQDYGDRVTSSPDALGHQYGLVNDGFGTTPNVLLSYGGALPTLWTTGYGDLVNVYFNDQDGQTSLDLTLNADPGFEVGLFGFDLASFSSAGQTIPGLQVRNATNDAILFSQGATLVTGTSHIDFDFPAGLFAPALTLDIDLTGLGTVSDNIALDNVYFVQQMVIPEPSTLLLLGTSLAGLASCRRPRQSPRSVS